LNQTDLCQNLAHQVQLQRDKMANLVMELQQQPLSNSSTLEQESRLKMLQGLLFNSQCFHLSYFLINFLDNYEQQIL
jgi:hypothetical protein